MSKSEVKPLLSSISPLERKLSYLSNFLIVLCMYESSHAMDNPSPNLLMKFYFLIFLYALFHCLLLNRARYEYHFVPDISSKEYAKNQQALLRKNKLCIGSEKTYSGFVIANGSGYGYIKENYQFIWQPGQRELEMQARMLHQLLQILKTTHPSLNKQNRFPTLPSRLTSLALLNPFDKSLLLMDFVPFLRLIGYADVFLCIRQAIRTSTATHPAWIILNAVILFIALTVNTYTAHHREQISKCEGFSLKARVNNSLLCLEKLVRQEYLIYPTATFEELLTFIIHAETVISKINISSINKKSNLYGLMSEMKTSAKKFEPSSITFSR